MADKQVKVSVIVSDDGTMRLTEKSAKQLGRGLEKAGNSAKNTERQMKGVGQTSLSTGKGFSKMAQGITGGLVPAYATLAANIFAVTALFGFLKDAGDLRVLQEGQVAYASVTGVALGVLTSDIRKAAGGLLEFKDAAQAAAIGVASGLSGMQLETLAKGAKNVSQILGRDVTDSFNRLVRGVTKAEPELLDELGITLRLTEAKEKFAISLGKVGDALTLAEQKQAVFVEVSSQLEDKFSRINDIMSPENNSFTELAVSFDDALKVIKSFVEVIASPVAKFFTNNVEALIAVMFLFAVPIIKSIIPSLENWRAVTSEATAAVVADMTEAQQKIDKLTAKKASIQPGSPEGNAQGIASKLEKGRARTSLKALQDGEKLNQRQIKSIITSLEKKTKTFEKLTKQERVILKTNLKMMLTNAQTTAQSITVSLVQSARSIGLSFQIMSQKAISGLLAIKVAAIEVAGFFAKWAGRLLSIVSGIGLVAIAAELLLIPFKALFGKEATKEITDQVEAFDEMAKRQGKLVTEYSKLVEVQKVLIEKSGVGADTFKTVGVLISSVTQNVSALSKSMEEATKTSEAYQNSFDGKGGYFSIMLPLLDSILDFTGKAGTTAKAIEAAETALLDLARSGKLLTSALKELGLDQTADAQAFIALNNILAVGTKLNDKQLEKYNELAIAMAEQSTILGGLTQARIDDNRAYDKAILSILQYDTKSRQLEETLRKRLVIEKELKAVLNSSNLDQTKVDRQIDALNAQIALISRLRSLEVTAAKQKGIAEKNYQKGLRGASNYEKARLKRTKDITNLTIKMVDIETQLQVAKSSGIKVDADKQAILENQLLTLKAQRDVLSDQESLIKQLDLAIKNSLESSLTTNIADLLKGDESSLKDAVAKIAKSVFESIADTLAKSMSEKLLGAIGLFQDPATKLFRAHEAGAEVVSMKIRKAFEDVCIPQPTTAAQAKVAAPVVPPVTPPVTPPASTGGIIDFPNGPPVFTDTSVPVTPTRGTLADMIASDGGTVRTPLMRGNEVFGPSAGGSTPLMRGDEVFGPLVNDFPPLATAAITEIETATLSCLKAVEEQKDGPLSQGATPKSLGLPGAENIGTTILPPDAAGPTKGIFGTFVSDFGAIFDKNAEGGFLGKMGNLFGNLTSGLGGLFKGLPDLLGGLFGGGGGGMASLFGGIFGFASGGIMSGGMKAYANGGIINKPTVGLIGEGRMNEAVVPLPDGKSIPVVGAGSQQTSNVSVNVNMSSDGQSKDSVVSNDQQGGNLGRAISSAVQAELQRQKRPGGILSPYGAA